MDYISFFKDECTHIHTNSHKVNFRISLTEVSQNYSFFRKKAGDGSASKRPGTKADDLSWISGAQMMERKRAYFQKLSSDL